MASTLPTLIEELIETSKKVGMITCYADMIKTIKDSVHPEHKNRFIIPKEQQECLEICNEGIEKLKKELSKFKPK